MVSLTWEDVSESVRLIADYVKSRNFAPDIIVGIARGGLIPAVMLSHCLGVRRIGSIEAQRNIEEKSYSPGHELFVGKAPREVGGLSVLLVDDIVGEGVTVKVVKSMLREARELIAVSLVLNTKRCTSRHVVDFYAQSATDWVCFPWEKHE